MCYTQLRLDPLRRDSAHALLNALLGDDVALGPLKERLNERTQGNPFFLEESIRSLVETEGLVGGPGAYRLAEAPVNFRVPSSVHAVLAARIDRLSPGEKCTLQAAAAIGKDVPFAVLYMITEVPEEELRLSLIHLQRAEFLYETSLFPEMAHTFKHALTQEVAYGSLLLSRRLALHGRIVEAMERLYPERLAVQVDRLAYHAYRGKVWGKAVTYCRQAGEKAMARSAHHEAVGYFAQALDALDHLPKDRPSIERAIDLRIAQHWALRPFGDFGRMLPVLHEAEALAAALGDSPRLAQVSCSLSHHLRTTAAYDQALAAAQRACALATASGDAILSAVATRHIGQAHKAQGDYRRAIDSHIQVVACFEGPQRRELSGRTILQAVDSRAHLASCHAELGAFAEGRALGEEGLRIAEAVGHPASLMLACWGIGILFLRQGDLSRAIPRLEQAVGLCQEADLPFWFPASAAVLGEAYALCGRVDDAIPLLTQALERATAVGREDLQALCHLRLGEAQLRAGDLKEALQLAEGAMALAHKQQERGNLAYAIRLLGEIATHRHFSKFAQAEDYYRQALVLTRELGMRPLQAHCHFGLGILYAQTDRREQARAELTTAIDLYRSMDMTFWLPQAEAMWAHIGG